MRSDATIDASTATPPALAFFALRCGSQRAAAVRSLAGFCGSCWPGALWPVVSLSLFLAPEVSCGCFLLRFRSFPVVAVRPPWPLGLAGWLVCAALPPLRVRLGRRGPLLLCCCRWRLCPVLVAAAAPGLPWRCCPAGWPWPVGGLAARCAAVRLGVPWLGAPVCPVARPARRPPRRAARCPWLAWRVFSLAAALGAAALFFPLARALPGGCLRWRRVGLAVGGFRAWSVALAVVFTYLKKCALPGAAAPPV